MADKYREPMCDCGCELKVHEAHGIEYYYKITSRGKVAKTPIKDYTSDIKEVTNLECKSCYNIYEIDWDTKGRITRGKLMDFKYINSLG